MKERIKELRKALNLTQQEFADRLGIKRNTVANYETGRNDPVDSVSSLIVREFNVNEEWLRTGTGAMFKKVSRDEQIAAFVGSVLAGETDSFKHRLLSALTKLDAADWEALERVVDRIEAERKKD